jgi:hypothetical protein
MLAWNFLLNHDNKAIKPKDILFEELLEDCVKY